MKKRTNIIILISLLGFTLSNCIDEFDAKIPDGGVGLLVVEGNIISDSTVLFSLSRTFSLNEDDLPSGYNKVTADVRDRKSTRLNSSHPNPSRMPSSA